VQHWAEERGEQRRTSEVGVKVLKWAMTSVEEGIRAMVNVAHVGWQVHVGSGGLEHGIERVADGARASATWPVDIAHARAGDRCGRLGGACD
jgi:hypothetical protein